MSSKVGRPPRTIEWKEITYNASAYIVGKIQFNDEYQTCELRHSRNHAMSGPSASLAIASHSLYPVRLRERDILMYVATRKSDEYVYCVVDADVSKLNEHNWHVVSGSYIGCYKMHEDKRKTLYLHNFVMNLYTFNGKGREESIDHINGIGFDNRRANLRLVSQSLQNINTRQRVRTVNTLPPEIAPSDIPRNIWYIPPTKTHGARFCVEFKGIPGVGDIVRKTTSSKDVSIVDKLNHAKEICKDIIDAHPVLKEHSRTSDKSIHLKTEYEAIVELAK
jgi:hypothetical protein